MNETRTVGDLLERFIAELETKKAPNWWETFYRNVPSAGVLANDAVAVMGGRMARDLSDGELKTLVSTLRTIKEMALAYAASRGETIHGLSDRIMLMRRVDAPQHPNFGK